MSPLLTFYIYYRGIFRNYQVFRVHFLRSSSIMCTSQLREGRVRVFYSLSLFSIYSIAKISWDFKFYLEKAAKNRAKNFFKFKNLIFVGSCGTHFYPLLIAFTHFHPHLSPPLQLLWILANPCKTLSKTRHFPINLPFSTTFTTSPEYRESV